MDLFDLPDTTKVNRIVPKNAFDKYTKSKQKKMFSDLIARITWMYKLSPQTINLAAKEVSEIQIFNVTLKSKTEINQLLDIIDKAIPYHIIFIVAYEDDIYLSTSSKHPNPLNENNTVIDWTFKTDWFKITDNQYQLTLKKNLDAVFQDFCAQLANTPKASSLSLRDLIKHSEAIAKLKSEITRLKSRIANTPQFNKKVDLNIRLKELERELSGLVDKQ